MAEGVLSSVRVDKWLWGSRICKTRKVVSELCKQHKVLIEGQPVKRSREVSLGQVVVIKRDGILWHYRVIKCLDKRVSAPVSLQFKEDVTPQENLDQLKMIKRDMMPRRPKGAGRPTKKERRDLSILKEASHEQGL